MKTEARELLSHLEDKNSEDRFLKALQVLLDKKPYSDIAITEICQEAMLSRKTFYKYFEQKDALIEYLVESMCIEYSATDDRSNFYYYFMFWFQQKDWVRVLIKNDLLESAIMLSTQKYEKLLHPRNWGLFFQMHPDAKALSFEFINGGCSRLLRWWSQNGFQKSPQELAEIVDYILSGTLSNTGAL